MLLPTERFTLTPGPSPEGRGEPESGLEPSPSPPGRGVGVRGNPSGGESSDRGREETRAAAAQKAAERAAKKKPS